MHISLPQEMITKLPFISWLPWSEREQSPAGGFPGVYLIAHFDSVPRGPVDPITREIVYIGQTAADCLKQRWRRFQISATTGRRAHSGGRNYHAHFAEGALANAYVSALSVEDLHGSQLKAYLLFIERALIWSYAIKWNELPSCNKE